MDDLQIVEQGKALSFSRKQIETLKKTLCKGRTDTELELFLNVCKGRGLNPFAYQIYCVSRWSSAENREVMSVQTGIAGFRSIAQDTKQFAGEGDTIFYDEAGKEYPKIWLNKEHPFACSVGVEKIIGRQQDGTPIVKEYRKLVYWDSVVQTKKDKTPTAFWLGAKGIQQIEKCATAASLRAAFPEKLGGIYSEDEMAHLDGEFGEAARKKSEKTQDFLVALDPHVRDRMTTLGYNTEAKQRALCNESEGNLDTLILNLEAVEFTNTWSEDLKNKIKYCGWKNMPEVRRMLRKIGKTNWTLEYLDKYIKGEAV